MDTLTNRRRCMCFQSKNSVQLRVSISPRLAIYPLTNCPNLFSKICRPS